MFCSMCSEYVQSCRDQYPTRESEAPALRLQLPLSIIGVRWLRIVKKKRHAERRAKNRMRRRFNARLKQVVARRQRIDVLHEKHQADLTSISITDFDDLVRGHERKIPTIFKNYPRSEWPTEVPYPNIIARSKYLNAENARLKREN